MQKLRIWLFLLVISLAGRAQDIPYTSCPHCWNPDSLGNHRAVVRFDGPGNVAHTRIPWRLPIADPFNHRIIVQDAKTGARVPATSKNSTREAGDIYFEPSSGKGAYYVYYLPYRNEGRSNYPKGVYLAPDTLANVPTSAKANAVVTAFQSIDTFNTFYPMEVIATATETSALKAKHPGAAFLLFPEDREHPIRMQKDVPLRWIRQGRPLNLTAAKGENYSLQIGLYALRDLEDLQITIKAPFNATCINTTGITYDGHPFTKSINIAKDRVQPLWCTVDIPPNATAATYPVTIQVAAKNTAAQTIRVTLVVSNKPATDDPAKMTHLHWLNSTLAQENTVIAPYTPLTLQGDTLIHLLGRNIQLSKQGFPEQIQTFFTPEMTEITTTPNNLLAENIHFHFTKQADGKDIRLKPQPIQFTAKSPGTLQWQATSAADELRMDVHASLEFDGFLAYTVKVIALTDLDLKDITMHIPFQKEMATYLMGLGQKGGYRPDSMVHWKWDVAHKNQDGAWIGAVNGGIQYSLRDEHYVRPLNTNFYLQKPLLAPGSWANGDKGGIDIGIKGRSMLANNYSGPRHLAKGDTLYYNFNLLITPFHPLDTDFQWATRFYHKYENLDTIKATGATVVNIHHATPINPWINYPFIEAKRLKSYIDSAHRLGLKVKIYNTVRELSDHAYETFALRSLGHEIYSAGPGKGFSWLQEHWREDYIPAWFVPEIKDAAIINSGMSRWHNYYVEGMNWLVQNVGIDGIYLDDVAFDRITMKRIKRVLTRDGHPGIIDLHSANQYNPRDGFNNSANLYMEHFPYLNRLWFGEYFDYEKNPPDFFLVEVSGIPFGLMGEMLEHGGNPWRGMVFGMTNRMPWSDNADPRPIWKAWDEFGMQGTKMIGYWSPNCPVTTGNARIPATVYQKSGAALVALASWSSGDSAVTLHIDWQKLGIDPAHATIEAPAIDNFQPARKFTAGDPIPVGKGKGWILVIR
ncbi:MAG TPA: glycoside hydrolase domain-containing protein [Puia sp.]